MRVALFLFLLLAFSLQVGAPKPPALRRPPPSQQSSHIANNTADRREPEPPPEYRPEPEPTPEYNRQRRIVAARRRADGQAASRFAADEAMNARDRKLTALLLALLSCINGFSFFSEQN